MGRAGQRRGPQMSEIKDYLVTIEHTIDGRRFSRTILGADECDAIRRAYRLIAGEINEYYVLCARLA